MITASILSCGVLTGRWFEPLDVLAAAEKRDPEEPDDHASGRSRGGFSSKIHLICDVDGCPIHFEISVGQAHENTSLVDLLWFDLLNGALMTR